MKYSLRATLSFLFFLPSVAPQCQNVWVQIGDAFGNAECPMDGMAGDAPLGGLTADVYIDATATTAVYRCRDEETLVYDLPLNSDQWTLRTSNGLPSENPGGPVSADGTTVMTGAGVYTFDGTVWNQLGTDIVDPSSTDHTRQDISGDGLTVAYLFFPFRAEIFSFAAGSWSMTGVLQPPNLEDGFFASDVAVSQDGETVAISALRGVDTGEEGIVFVYRLVGGSFQQIGQELEGNLVGDQFGQSLALSQDGNTLAVGAPLNNGPSSSDFFSIGEVRVFQLQGGNTWVQLGEDIEGAGVICTEEPVLFSPSDPFCFDNTGASVALSGDGTRVAIASSDTDGYLRVFGFSNGSWMQLGGDLFFDNQVELFGRDHHVSMSEDGSIIAVGGLGSQVEVFQLQCVDDATPRPTQAPFTPPGPRCRLGPLCPVVDVVAGIFGLSVLFCLV